MTVSEDVAVSVEVICVTGLPGVVELVKGTAGVELEGTPTVGDAGVLAVPEGAV